MIRSVSFGAVLVALCGVTRISFASQRARTANDYEQVGTAILKRETGPDARGTIFIGFDDFDSRALVPAFQRIYKGLAIVDSSGEDWGNTANGCHVDKRRHTMATGIFVSRPIWRGGDEIAFLVTYAACSVASRMSTYVFDRQGHHWILKAIEPRGIS